MPDALITVRCDCGEVRYAAYGERWTCSCGRRWNTTQIPEEEYRSIMREGRNERLRMMAVAAAIALGFAALTIAIGPRAWGLAPIAIGFWYLFLMPMWRRRVRARARSLPTWKLRPER